MPQNYWNLQNKPFGVNLVTLLKNSKPAYVICGFSEPVPPFTIHRLELAGLSRGNWLLMDFLEMPILKFCRLAWCVAVVEKCLSSCSKKRSIIQRENLHSSDWWPHRKNMSTSTLIKFSPNKSFMGGIKSIACCVSTGSYPLSCLKRKIHCNEKWWLC